MSSFILFGTEHLCWSIRSHIIIATFGNGLYKYGTSSSFFQHTSRWLLVSDYQTFCCDRHLQISYSFSNTWNLVIFISVANLALKTCLCPGLQKRSFYVLRIITHQICYINTNWYQLYVELRIQNTLLTSSTQIVAFIHVLVWDGRQWWTWEKIQIDRSWHAHLVRHWGSYQM